MITVKINGNEIKKYEDRKKLIEIVSELYLKDSVLDSVKIDKKDIQISELDRIDIWGDQTVELFFITISQSIFRISESAMEFLDWIDVQNIENDIFSILPRIVNGFEMLENAINSIKQIRPHFETREEEELKSNIFMEINSFVALENKDETVKRIKKVCVIYRKIFSQVLETEGI